MSTECQSCKEPDMIPVNEYHEGEILWTEWVCDHCGAYCQTSRVDVDYDPTPNEEGEPPITWRERAKLEKPR